MKTWKMLMRITRLLRSYQDTGLESAGTEDLPQLKLAEIPHLLVF